MKRLACEGRTFFYAPCLEGAASIWFSHCKDTGNSRYYQISVNYLMFFVKYVKTVKKLAQLETYSYLCGRLLTIKTLKHDELGKNCTY